MKIVTCLVAAAVLAGGGISAAHATVATENIDGVVVPVGLVSGGNQIQSGVINETEISGVGQTLTGIGVVNSIAAAGSPLSPVWQNGNNNTELAFVFTNYVSSTVTPPSASTAGTVTFTGGTVTFYTLAAGTNLSLGSIAADVAAVEGGTLWLSETGAVSDSAGDTLISSLPIDSTLSNFSLATGAGFLDVTGGPAGSSFNTSTFANAFDVANGGMSDQSLSSDFSTGASGDFPISGSATVKANAMSVPEPMSAALLGFGILSLAFVYRRRAIR